MIHISNHAALSSVYCVHNLSCGITKTLANLIANVRRLNQVLAVL